MQAGVVLAKCFQGGLADEVVALSKTYGLFDIWKAALQAYGSGTKDSGAEKHSAAYSQLMRACLQPLLRPKEDYPPFPAKDSDHCCLAKAAALLLDYTRRASAIEPAQFTTLFLQTLQHCYRQRTDKLMLGELVCQLLALDLLTLADAPTLSNPKGEKNKPVSLKWILWDGDPFGLLSSFAQDLCKALRGVKKPMALVAVLTNSNSKQWFVVPSRHLCTVMALFELMVRAKRISCKGNRGIILFLSRHIKAPEDEPEYNCKSFRMQKSRALKYKDHKLLIKKAIKDLFFKYCPGEKSAKIFEDYFS